MSGDDAPADTNAAFDRTLTADGRGNGDDVASADTWLGAHGDERATAQDFADLPVVDPQNYVMGTEFARGGMGRILTMRDRRLGRRVAIKELLRDNPALVQRFQREALITSRLQHPAIVAVYEAGRWPSGEPFFAMKLVDGRSLKEVIAETNDVEQRMALLPSIIAAVDALAYAHEHKIIHRDLKPANVLIGDYGETVVIDWGLAKSLASDDDSDDDVDADHTSADETVAGTVLGTPAYMAPEQARGDAASERTDVYALGALLYATLAGRAPYSGPSAQSVVEKVTSQPPTPLAELAPDLPVDLQAIVAKAMARDPADRYPSAIELARDLTRFQTGQLVRAHDYTTGALVRRWLRRHRAAVLVASAALVIVAVGAVFSLARIVSERDRARRAQRVAETAEQSSRARADELVLSHARSIVDSDPLAALGWLRKLSPTSDAWSAARTIAERARARGLPRVIDARVRSVEAYDVSPDGKTIALVSEDEAESRDWLLIDVATGKVERGGGHAGRIRYLEFSPDGRSVVTASDDNTVGVWTLATGNKQILRGHQGFVTIAVFTAGGKKVMSVSLDGTARLWDLASGTSRVIPSPYGVGIAPSGDIVCTVQREQPTVLRLQDLTTNTIQPLRGHSGRITTFDYTQDSSRIASGDINGDVWVWDATRRTGKRIGKHDGRVHSVDWTPDGKQLITGGSDRTVRVWNLATGKHWVFRDHTEAVRYVKASPDGRWLATRSRAGTVRIVDLTTRTGQRLARPGNQVSFTPDSQHVITVNPKNDFEVWNLQRNRGRLFRAGKEVRDMAVQGRRILTAGGDWSVRVIDTPTGEVKRLRGHRGTTLAVAASPDGRLAASLDSVRQARLWDLTSGKSVRLPGRAVLAVTFSPDGEYLAAPGDLDPIRLWHVRSGALRTLRGHKGWVKQVAFSPTRRELASVGSDGTVRLWDVASGKHRVLGKHDRPCHLVAFSPDGNHIASAGEDGVVNVFGRDGSTRALRGHTGWVTALVFSPDGRRLASAGHDRTIRIWQPTSGTARVLRADDQKPVLHLAFSPDGRRLASAHAARVAHIWDIATGERRSLEAHRGRVTALAWTPDGSALITAATDGTVRMWSDDLPHEPTALRTWLADKTSH